MAGDYREEVETQKRGLPWLMHAPIIGSAFRRVEDRKAESELVFLITPRFISEVDQSLVPRLGPGQLTDVPSDHEHYLHGYTEVPRCNDDCPVSDRFDDPSNYGNYPNYPMSMDQSSNQQEPIGGQPMNVQGWSTNPVNQQLDYATPSQPANFSGNGVPQGGGFGYPTGANSGFGWSGGR